MFSLMIWRNEQTLLRTILHCRALHGPLNEMDPMLKTRDNLPIIRMPYTLKGNLKKIRRQMFFEETIKVKRAAIKNKKKSS